MKKLISIALASFLALLLTTSTAPAQSPQKSQAPTEWIANSLKEIQKIKVGMTRADLLKVFTTEGGLIGRSDPNLCLSRMLLHQS